MTAPLPSSRLSPIAGLALAVRRLYIRQAAAEIHRLEALLANELDINRRLKGARS